MPAGDPYKYFRMEARELLDGLLQGAAAIERGSAGAETVERLLRQAHTLKGAARVVKRPEMADAAHAVEDALVAFQSAGGAGPGDTAAVVLRLLHTLQDRLAALDAPPPTASRPAAPRADDGAPRVVRLEIAALDELLDNAAAARMHLSALSAARDALGGASRQAAALARQRAGPGADALHASLKRLQRDLDHGIDGIEGELLQIQERTRSLRLVPADALFQPLERTVRDAAEAMGKEAAFTAEGGDTRLDGDVLGAAREALLHLVRNAVAHGIESPAERAAAGKPRRGEVRLQVERRGGRVAFLCRDDGCGIDPDAVRTAAVQRGLLSRAEAAALDDGAAARLVLRGNLSTSGAVSQIAGRGLGLDVVREVAARLKGDLDVDSRRGQGTTVTLSVPVSLTSLAALVLDVGGAPISLPLDAVRWIRRLGPDEILRSGDGLSVIHQGQGVPFVALARLLGGANGSGDAPRACTAVVVAAAGGLAAVGVDGLMGTEHLTVRPLPPCAGAGSVVAGASFDADWNPRPVLDPARLVEAVRERRMGGEPPPSPRRPPVLIIDDSLTTRMLEQSILETAGFEVDLAVSGEEGLEKARARRYGMFLCDIEMPGMDGFEFVENTRTDAALREVPTILVTSRASAADRRRGEEVGARAYVVKSEFDEVRLLQIMRELMP